MPFFGFAAGAGISGPFDFDCFLDCSVMGTSAAGAFELGDVEDSPTLADEVAAPGESSELGEMPLPLPDPTPLASLPSAPPSSPPFSF